MKISAFALSLLILAPFAASAAPDPTPDATAPVVFLRQNCNVSSAWGIDVDDETVVLDGNGDPLPHDHTGSLTTSTVPMENCFESMFALSDPTTGWIWQTR